MKQKVYVHEWQCPGCYQMADDIYVGFIISTKEDAPKCCGAQPMCRVNVIKVKVKV